MMFNVIVFEANECLLTKTHTTLFCKHAEQNSSSHFCWNVGPSSSILHFLAANNFSFDADELCSKYN